MARAKLHLICGNCGCSDDFEWEFQPLAEDNGDGTFSPSVWLWCNNCSTLHDIGENAKKKANKV